MNTPIWVVVAVAAFGTVQWLWRLLDRCIDIHIEHAQRTMDAAESLPSWTLPPEYRVNCDGPVNVENASGDERRRVEFNVTFHQGGKEVARVNAVGFVVDGRALVNIETFRFKAISSDPVKICIREAQSDVPIGVSVVPLGGSPRQGDEVQIGEVRLGVSL